MHNYLHSYKITLDKTYKNHTFSMTFFKNIHRSRRTGPNLMKGNCAFQKRKICGFNDKYPSKSINFVSLNFTIKIYLPLDIISLNFFVPLDSQTHHEHKHCTGMKILLCILDELWKSFLKTNFVVISLPFRLTHSAVLCLFT